MAGTQELVMNKAGQWDGLASLVGEPVEDSLDRGAVEGLRFSPKQAKRPSGMSRDDYVESAPGEDTQVLVALSGAKTVRRRAGLGLVTLGLACVMCVLGAGWVWFTTH